MSCVVDTSPLISGACVVSAYSGHGIRGDAIPSTGADGASILYNDATLPADAAAEFRALILTTPSAGTFTPYEDGSFTLVGAADGTYTFTYRLFKDGADLGVNTVTTTFGSGGPSDTTPPTMVGSITVSSLTTSSYTTSISAATDNVAVTGYQVSQDGGSTWIDKGTTRTHNHTGRTPGSTDTVQWRAGDAAGLWATPLSASVTLLSLPVGTAGPMSISAYFQMMMRARS